MATSCPRITARPLEGTISVERIRNSVVLPLPFGPEQAEQLGRTHVERDAIQRGAALVAVHHVLDGD